MTSNESTEKLLFERILKSLETIAEISARLVILETICTRLEKIVSSGNGSEALVVQMVRVREDIAQIKNMAKDIKTSSVANIEGQWKFKAALIQTIPGLLGGSAIVALLKFFGK